ncbi:MAG: hypothetical protein MZV65_16020 [Chromatiales bacterium]|nr:hypothetical protein [Chromatiales bacterium]
MTGGRRQKLRDTLTWLQDEAGYAHLAFATAVDLIERKVFQLTYAVRNHELGPRAAGPLRDRPGPPGRWNPSTGLWGQAWTYQRELQGMVRHRLPGQPAGGRGVRPGGLGRTCP